MDLQLFQFIANLSALGVVGLLYLAYVRNLRSTIDLKNNEVLFWKDKAAELEKKTSAHIEHVLAKRIEIREKELLRLKKDDENHRQEIKERNNELQKLRLELARAKEVGRSLYTYDRESKQEVPIPASDLELVEIGEVFVDSASLLIVDPAYIDGHWIKEASPPGNPRLKDTQTAEVYEHQVDFQDFGEHIEGFDTDVRTLIKSGRFELISKPVPPPPYKLSMAGAMAARRSGFGQLAFEDGEGCAAVVTETGYGDGIYPVFGEIYEGRIVRVYISFL